MICGVASEIIDYPQLTQQPLILNMLIRLLILFAIVWFLIWFIRKQFSTDAGQTPPDSEQNAEDMVQCEYCGIHVPRSLASRHQGKFYCKDDHIDLDRQA